ncbi:MAG: glyoxalase [Kordiimonadaceae bacterium]|jgi:catechol-2,3-dioxygenase|nr:glyoxalase [Kordiimonadaceae bacterium]MBT6033696.1 glyoxalase [Kordiimonadaceae bacterium]
MYRPKPLKLGHIVLKVQDIKKSVAFYTDVVGLEVSDWINDHMVFMRAGSDHHDMALLQLPPGATPAPEGHYPSVEHFSYQLADLKEMEQALTMLQERGIEIDRGLGKHGPGENTFLVFKDPDGNNVEFYTDMRQIDEEHPYEASVWDGNVLETFDQWKLEKFVVEPPDRVKATIPK